MNELIAFLRNNTPLCRFVESEIREVIARMEDGGWEIVRKDDGVIAQPEPAPKPDLQQPPEWVTTYAQVISLGEQITE